jgi:hypothetical protein
MTIPGSMWLRRPFLAPPNDAALDDDVMGESTTVDFDQAEGDEPRIHLTTRAVIARH